MDNDNSENGMIRERGAEEHFRVAFQLSRDILYCVNIKTGLYEYFSPSLKILTGYEPEDIAKLGNIGFGFLVHPDDLDILARHILRIGAIRGDENDTYTIEYRFRHKDGRFIWLSDNHAVKRDAQGVPAFFIGNLRDVSEQHRIDQELRDNDIRFRAMLDNGIDMIALLDENGNFLFESSTMGPPVDLSDEYESTSGFYWVHPDDRTGAIATFQDLASKSGAQSLIELQIRNSDGSWRAYECRATNMLHDERVRGIVLNLHDITERRAALNALRDSEARFRALIEHGVDRIAILDEQGTFLFAAPMNGLLLGYEARDFEHMNVMDLVHPDDREHAGEIFKSSLDCLDVPTTFEARLIHKNGAARFFEVTIINMLDNAAIRGIVANAHEITARKLAEERMRGNEQRLRALSHELFNMQERERERLSRELHDELGQKLTGIALAFEGFAQQSGADPEFVRNLKNILEKANAELRNIYRGLRPVALDRLGISVALEELAREFKDKGLFAVQTDIVHLEPAEAPPDAAINIYRVLQEALTNVARHAHASQVVVRLQRGKDTLVLTVEDNGRGFGFDAASLDQGLGLFSMKERLALLGGALDIISQPGKGVTLKAVFKIPGRDAKPDTQTT